MANDPHRLERGISEPDRRPPGPRRGAVLLSGARPRRNAVSPSLGVTIDQTIANKYGSRLETFGESNGRVDEFFS